jgi:hypothetical protein
LNVKEVHSLPGQARSVYRNIEAGWSRHICCGKAISVASSECVASVIQLEKIIIIIIIIIIIM